MSHHQHQHSATRHPTPATTTTSDRDRGAILPMVLVVTIVFVMIIGSVAAVVTSGLRYSRVVEDRADRLAAADGGLRYGVEKLRNLQTLCTTAAGTGGGFTTVFPPQINGANTKVTCRRIGNPISDIQGWGAVITGDGVPADEPTFLLKGGGGSTTDNIKTFRGPVYVADPTRLHFAAKLVIEDGDLWHTQSDCETAPPPFPEIDSGYLTFEPSFLRGPACADTPWNELFKPPTRNVPSAQARGVPAAHNDVIFPGCRVFFPGKYTAQIPLAANNYFVSGDYYFENVPFSLTAASAVFGFPSGSGDTPKVEATKCEPAMIYDQSTSGERGGATIWLGGSSNIAIGTGGELEIFRRQQNETFLSVYALSSNGAGFVPSALSYKEADTFPWLLQTKSGNTNDVAIHGLFWAPYSTMSLGNITNASVGQLVGGLAIAKLDTQASNSAAAFSIGVETNPAEARLLLEATATKDGRSTVIRAVVQFRPDSRQLAINSWRVVG